MEFAERELLAFMVIKELGTEKSDVDLIKSIRQNREKYRSAVREIPVEASKARIMKNPL